MSTIQHLSARYGEMAVFANDTGALTQSLKKYGEWAEIEIQFMMHFLAEGDSVVDVGACIGTHTLAFASKVGKTGRVISIETQRSAYKLLDLNIKTNKLSNVVTVNAVAAAKDGGITIEAINQRCPCGLGIKEVAIPINRAVNIGCVESDQITIDDLNLEQCSLLKIDTDGMEHSVINGAILTLNRNETIVFSECNSIESGLKTVKTLQHINYVVYMYVSSEFNADNFLNNIDNYFGSAKRASIVGVPRSKQYLISSITLKDAEILMRIETADDLALGLLNKPQYVGEILAPSTAALDGGRAWINELTNLRTASRDLSKHVEAQRNLLSLLKKDLQIAKLENIRLEMVAKMSEQSAVSSGLRVDAAILQASLARREGERHAAMATAEISDRHSRLEVAENDRARLAILADSLLRSTSWRVTRPLRVLKRLFGKR